VQVVGTNVRMKIGFAFAIAFCCLCSAQCFSQLTEKEPPAVLELGAAPSRSLTENRANWRSSSSASSGALKECLTVPTLLEMGISRQLRHFRTSKLITSTCNAGWDERRTTCDTVLPSSAPSVQNGLHAHCQSRYRYLRTSVGKVSK
jgi:hypothetical protein